mgnify:CR=1 FL=1
MGYTHSVMIRTLYILICTVLLLVAGCRASSDTALAPTAATDNPPTLDLQQVARGAEIYALHCAECHGANLEGEADWKLQNPDGSFRAPPHDASGHTWHHSDVQLIDAVRRGGARLSPDVGGTSAMPAYDDTLTDEEIAAVLDYIKSTWPEDIRRYQWERTTQ